MSFNNTSCLSSYNNQLPPNTNCIDERDRFLELKQIHQRKLLPVLHSIVKEYLNLNSFTLKPTSEEWKAHIILEHFENQSFTMWPLEKIKECFMAAFNDDDLSLLSVLLQIEQIKKIKLNTLFPDIPDAEYMHDGNKFQLNFLHLAVKIKKHYTLKYLLESNLFDVNFKTCKLSLIKKYDRTPLHFAIMNMDAIAIRLLLRSSNIKPEIANANGLNPFRELIENPSIQTTIHNKDKYLECIETFIKLLPENIFAKTCNGNTLLEAYRLGLAGLTIYLINSPYMVKYINYKNKNGQTILSMAISIQPDQELSIYVIKTLLNHPKIDVNLRCICGPEVTPLHLALLVDNMAAFKLLLSHPKIKVNKKEKNYSYFQESPAYAAVKLNNIEAVKLLIEKKADFYSTTKIHHVNYEKDEYDPDRYRVEIISPFDLAVERRNCEILRLLSKVKMPLFF